MIPAIWPAALFAAGFSAALLGPAASAATGLGALLAKAGSCFASRHFTALHLGQVTDMEQSGTTMHTDVHFSVLYCRSSANQKVLSVHDNLHVK